MKKHFVSPTFASSQKTMPPVNIRERIIRLNEAVNELRSNVEVEAQHADSLEKMSSKQYSLVSTQIKALRKAFNTLADVVMEELDSIKSDVFKDFQDANSEIHRKIDDLTHKVDVVQSDKQDYGIQLTNTEHDLRERMRDLERKLDDQTQYFQSMIERVKEDNKLLFEKLKIVVNNNTNQLDLLTKDTEKLQNNYSSLRTQGNSNSNSVSEASRRIHDLEELVKSQFHELSSQLGENRNDNIRLKDNLINETQNVLRAHSDLSRRLEEFSARINERIESADSQTKHKLQEIENLATQIQQDFQENIQDLARIHKESSTQIILDFEKAITSVNNDTKILYKKFNIIENNLNKNREELAAMITEHEHVVSKKNESFNKAIFDICRQINISNPLLSY